MVKMEKRLWRKTDTCGCRVEQLPLGRTKYAVTDADRVWTEVAHN